MRPLVRFASTLAVGTLLAFSVSVPQASNSGREEGRCLRLCLAARLACVNACGPTCATMFPNNIEQRIACTSACRDECLREEVECNLRCTGEQPPQTEEEP